MYEFMFQVMTSLYLANSIIMYIFSLDSSSLMSLPSSSFFGTSSITSWSYMQFWCETNFIMSISFLTASSWVQTCIPMPSGRLKYYLCFLRVSLLNLLMAKYWDFCSWFSIFLHSLILQRLPLASRLFLDVILYRAPLPPWMIELPYSSLILVILLTNNTAFSLIFSYCSNYFSIILSIVFCKNNNYLKWQLN